MTSINPTILIVIHSGSPVRDLIGGIQIFYRKIVAYNTKYFYILLDCNCFFRTLVLFLCFISRL